MRIDDWCCLGRTVPEESKKYGLKVCSVGYSDELRAFVRVYPLPVRCDIKQRMVCQLELVRNPGDSRDESWKLTRDDDDGGINRVSTFEKQADVVAWLGKHVSPSIADLNERRRSIGVLKIPTEQIKGVLRQRKTPDGSDPEQKLFFEDIDENFGQGAIPVAPYLEFRDKAGPHRIQVREWGCYEYLRNHPTKIDELWSAMNLDTPDSDTYLVVGNMNNHRTVWLVISFYVMARVKPVKGLFDDLPD